MGGITVRLPKLRLDNQFVGVCGDQTGHPLSYMYNAIEDIEIPIGLIEERRRKLAEFLYVDVSILKPEPGQLDYVGEMLVLAEEMRLKRERERKYNG